MNLRKLGKSELKVSPLGLGCWQFSQGKGVVGKVWDTLEQPAMDEIVKAAIEGGINWFDSAEVYGWGNSERALALALQRVGKQPGEVLVATKWWPMFRTARSLVDSFESRLQHLNPFPVDLLQIHQPISLSSIEKQAMGLARLLKARKVPAVGVSNFSPTQMRRVHHVLAEEGFVLASNQVRYNLLKRDIERDGTLATARELGIAIIAYSPLAQGLLTGRFHDDPGLVSGISSMRRVISGISPAGLKRSEALIRHLQEIARHYSSPEAPVSAAQVALNCLVNFQGEQVFAIPGASKARQAHEAAHAMDFKLSAPELADLDSLSAKF